jgi:hypothetical protein
MKNIEATKKELEKEKTLLRERLEETYKNFKIAYRYKKETDFKVGLSLLGVRITEKLNNAGNLTSIGERIYAMGFESIGNLVQAYGMKRQGMPLSQRFWERYKNSDNHILSEVLDNEAVKIAEAGNLIIYMTDTFIRPDIRDVEFRKVCDGKQKSS